MSESETDRSEWLTPIETARLLRCSRPTIYRRIAQGSIPAYRLDPNAPLLVPRRELEQRLFRKEHA